MAILPDRLCCRGSSNSNSCVREDRQQVSSFTDGLLGGLVGGMKHGLELGECVLLLFPREANLSRGSPGVVNGSGRYRDGGAG